VRLEPLQRSWEWIFTGPLEFRQRMQSNENVYRAGDALSFVDPFTGSGLLCAIVTGTLAGEAACAGTTAEDYNRLCSRLLRSPFQFSSLLRELAGTRAASPLLRLTPAALLFQHTRPLLY
jgi:menaquinone-9 beta-reductase